MTVTFKPSKAQQAYYDWIANGEGNAILEAVAGAGKTTTLLNGLARMTGRIWFGVYNTKMAVEIKDKIAGHDDLCGRPGLYTSTFHSAGYSALRFAFGRSGARLDVTDKKVPSLVKALVEAQGERAAHVAAALPAIVSMAKNRGIGALVSASDTSVWLDMIEHFDLDSNLPEDADMSDVVRFAQVLLARSNDNLDEIDFDDMVYLPLQRRLRMLQHEWVLVDEAQDTNPTRRALAAKLLSPTGRFVAVGDPYQAIFGFTGADNDALDQIGRAFNCTRLPLTITYRCPKAVVRHAQNWVPHIESGDTAPEGAFVEMNLSEEPDAFLDAIKAVTANNRRETAILCRYNKYLVDACFKLIRNGVPAKIEGRSIGDGLVKLATKWKVTKTETLRTRLDAWRTREIEKALKKEQEDKADRIADQADTLLVLIDKTEADGKDRVSDVVATIQSMFADDTSSKGLVTLCSAHRAKGLEWDTVYLLDRAYLMPSAYAKKMWQLDQERNLIYVAVTRAKQRLVEVNGYCAVS